MPPRLLAFALLALSHAALAQELPLTAPFTAPGVTGYDAAIPTPDEVLGFRIGVRHTRPDEAIRYVEALAAASDRVTVGFHGTTYEGRRLIHAIVTRPGRDLEAARRANERLSDAPASVSDADLTALPVVAYMGYSVHGDEASGTEAALLLLYHLAAGQGPAVETVLDHAVVIVDPMLNPDGRARFVDHVNAFRGGSRAFASTDPQDREHNQPWPRGRTNHYLFDLNRDWLPLIHPESRGRMALWHDWRPQLSTDFHEMGGDATYFFQPGIPSRNNPRAPRRAFELLDRVGTFHAGALDRIGTLYYARESFDDFYIGKGSTYPLFGGSVGILFEQASSRALVAETANGRLTYGETVRNQLATSLSSLEAAVALRTDLLRLQRDTYAGAPRFARDVPVRAYAFAADDPHRTADFVDVLRRHRIAVHRPAAPVRIDGQTLGPGEALVVPVDQPQARLITAAFERVTTFEDSLFYDVSTWTLPLAYGLRYAELDRAPALGEALADWPVEGRVVGGQAAFAYVLPWGSVGAARALYHLQAFGVRARVMQQPFTASVSARPAAFERGAVLVPVTQPDVDREAVHALVQRVVLDYGVDVFAVDSGASAEGPDFGSPSAPVLARPRVAILSGEGTHVNAVGEVWHLLNERLGMPASLLDVDRIGSAGLNRYSAIVMARAPGAGMTEAATEALRAWVRAGGTLVATETAVGWAVRHGFAALDERPVPGDTTARPWGDLPSARGAQVLGGAIFETRLDTTHPLGYGHRERLAVFKQGTQAFAPPARPGATVARYTDAPLVSGYASAPNQRRFAGASALHAERLGQGQVVLFDFNPVFRGHWWGTQGLLVNALFFGGTW